MRACAHMTPPPPRRRTSGPVAPLVKPHSIAASRLSASASSGRTASKLSTPRTPGAVRRTRSTAHSRCRPRTSASSPAAWRRAPAYCRTSSKSRYRISGPLSSATTSDLSTRSKMTASTSKSSVCKAQTYCAASSVQPPANTERRRRTADSASFSRSKLQPTHASRVRWRPSLPRVPPESVRRASPNRVAICGGVMVRTRAAANSRARGRPSTRRQISRTAATFDGATVKPGRTANARSTNKAPATDVTTP